MCAIPVQRIIFSTPEPKHIRFVFKHDSRSFDRENRRSIHCISCLSKAKAKTVHVIVSKKDRLIAVNCVIKLCTQFIAWNFTNITSMLTIQDLYTDTCSPLGEWMNEPEEKLAVSQDSGFSIGLFACLNPISGRLPTLRIDNSKFI